MNEIIHSEPHISVLFYIGLVVLALIALIPIVRMFVRVLRKVGKQTATVWDWVKPTLVVVSLGVALFLVLLGNAKTMENHKLHNARYSAPLPVFTESVKEQREALRPQTKTDLAVERSEQEAEAIQKESDEIDRKAADEAKKLMDFRAQFKGLDSPKED